MCVMERVAQIRTVSIHAIQSRHICARGILAILVYSAILRILTIDAQYDYIVHANPSHAQM